MSRFSRYDTDEERLPEGMTRVGYDADTQVYTFQDADGSYWESAPGNQFGQLTRTGTNGPVSNMYAEISRPRPSWRRDMMPMLQFGVIIGVFLLVLFWFLHATAGDGPSKAIVQCAEGTTKYTIQPDDTCWAISQAKGIDIKDILTYNKGIDCEKLVIGSIMCLPDSLSPV